MSRPSQPNRDLLADSLASDELPDPRASLSLLALAQAGDRAALEELVTRYHVRLRRIVRIQLRGSAVARHLDSIDIVQETFGAALPALKDLRPASAASLLQWLAVIATNRIRDVHAYLHAAKRDVARAGPAVGPDTADSPSIQPAASQPAPEEHVAMAELRELLDQQVAELPPDQRRVVLLRDYCGEGWARIAEELDREQGAARQLHQRAWIRLRSALKPRLGT